MNIRPVNWMSRSADIKHLCGSVWILADGNDDPPVYRVQGPDGEAILPTLGMLTPAELAAIARHKCQSAGNPTTDDILVSTMKVNLEWATDEILAREG